MDDILWEMDRLKARVALLEDALRVYAEVEHWGAGKRRGRVVDVWEGPGAGGTSVAVEALERQPVVARPEEA